MHPKKFNPVIGVIMLERIREKSKERGFCTEIVLDNCKGSGVLFITEKNGALDHLCVIVGRRCGSGGVNGLNKLTERINVEKHVKRKNHSSFKLLDMNDTTGHGRNGGCGHSGKGNGDESDTITVIIHGRGRNGSRDARSGSTRSRGTTTHGT